MMHRKNDEHISTPHTSEANDKVLQFAGNENALNMGKQISSNNPEQFYQIIIKDMEHPSLKYDIMGIDKVSEASAMDADRYFEILREDKAQSELRISTQMQALEGRLAKQHADTEQYVRELNEKADQRTQQMEARLTKAIDEIKEDGKETRKTIKANTFAVVGIALATLLGVGALAYAAFSAVSDIISLVPHS